MDFAERRAAMIGAAVGVLSSLAFLSLMGRIDLVSFSFIVIALVVTSVIAYSKNPPRPRP